jgi:phosphate transport system permease protein
MAKQVSVGAEQAMTRSDPATQINIQKRTRIGEALILGIMFFCAAVSIITTIGIVIVLTDQSLLFFNSGEVTLGEFFGTTSWQPQAGQFGIWALVSATLTTSAIAMLVALPLGLGAAIYMSEYATPRVRNTLKPILEILAGVPTVVYGFFALQFMTPILRSFLSIFGIVIPGVYNMLSPGIVMGVMIIPLVASLSEDALSAVPLSLREASYGLGATRLETATKVIVPAAISGIAASFILAVSRAFGETMIVGLAAGAGPKFTLNPVEAAETMTGHIARISSGDISFGTIDYNSLFAIGLMLFLMTLALNVVSNIIVTRFREVYE